jgi:phenylacetate-CoA ligase
MTDAAVKETTGSELQNLQFRRLKAKAVQVYHKVPFYQSKFNDHKVSPDDIKSLADLTRLPFTSKLDFRDNYPFGLMAVKLEKVVRIHASSGTTGRPITAPYSQKDIDTWAEIIAQQLSIAGVTKDDVLQNCYGYGLFTGGLGVHYGAERLGTTVVPTAVGNTKRQIILVHDLGSTVITCTPSYALTMSEASLDMAMNLHDSKLRLGIFGAEPWSEEMRNDIQEKLGILAIDIYGLTEIIGPGVAIECPYQCGLHIAEEHFLAEIIDPQSGEQLPYGEKGELVITTLTKEAQPVIRFRTKDITSLDPSPCKCGRTSVRMARVTGRSDDMLIVRGVNVFPSQIESVILSVDGVEPYYQVIVDQKYSFSSSSIEIWIEVSEGIFQDDIRKMEQIEHKLRSEIESVLGISARIKLVEPRSLVRSEGKAKRIVDRSEIRLL